MILWTIQSTAAWDATQRLGVLRASEAHMLEPSFRAAYEWMADEMRKRIGDPPSGVRLPVWAWAQYGNASLPKPDLAEAGHLEAGTPGVCIEFEMPPENVLLSDFDLWHFVFGQDTYIATTLDEMKLLDEWEAKDTDIYSEAEIRASWNRIFDLDFSEPDIALHERRSGYKGQYGKCRLQPYVMFRRSHQRDPIWARPNAHGAAGLLSKLLNRRTVR